MNGTPEMSNQILKIASFFGPYRFLSNFWMARVYGPSNLIYPSTEHAYQAAKTNDSNMHYQISELERPGMAKKLGKLVTLREDWEIVKIPIMLFLVKQKFQYPDLAKQLLDTGDLIIEEGNTWGDKFWGIDLKTGEGENNLGKILMQVRDDIRQSNSNDLSENGHQT